MTVVYIKADGKDYWEVETDYEKVLDAADCIVADNAEEACRIIDLQLDGYDPHFTQVQPYQRYNAKDQIIKRKKPALKGGLSISKVIDTIKEKGYVELEGWNTARIYEEKLPEGKTFLDYSIIAGYNSMTYDPEGALQQKRNRKIYPLTTRRKHFIYKHEIETFFYELQSEFQSVFTKNFYRTRHWHEIVLRANVPRVDDSKISKTEYCSCTLSYIKLFDRFANKYDYRRCKAFQKFKVLWKKEKPKNTKTLGLTEEFFEFMEKEIKIRKPVAMGKFRLKKFIRIPRNEQNNQV